jgi:hypothetical protein
MKKVGLVLTALLLVLFFIIPDIAEYYIESHDEELIGRELVIDDIDINYLTGNVTIASLYMLEQNAKDTFAGFEQLEVNLGILSSISGEYSIESLHLINPLVRITEYDSTFNFSDLIPTSDTNVSDSIVEEGDPVKYSVGLVRIRGLDAKYTDRNGDGVQLDSLGVNINPLAWNRQLLSGDFFISLLKGGEVGIDFELDIPNGDYQSDIEINNVELYQFSHFIRPFVNIQHLDGAYSNQLSVNGNYLSDPTDLTLKGSLRLDNFRLRDNYSIEQIAFDSLYIEIDSIDMRSNQYRLGQFALNSLAMNYALYPNTDSFSELLYEADSTGQDQEQTIDSAATQDTTSIYYSINKVGITMASLGFDDYTMLNDFNYSVDAISILTDSIDSSVPQSELKISALLNYKGGLKTKINFDLNDPKNFAYQATLDSVSMQDFSPYSLQFVGNPITRGLMHFEGSATTSAHFLKSDNQILLDQLKLGSRIKHAESYKLPVKTAVGLLKNPKGEIKIKLPVRGNLDDPSFRVGRTVLNTLKNLVVKTVASPVTVLGKIVTSSDKNVNEIPYQYLQTQFGDVQVDLIESVAKSINSRKGNEVSIIQYTNPPKEKAAIALFETKKKYYESEIGSDGFSISKARKILPIDSAFQSFVNRQISQDSVMSLSDKCMFIVGVKVIDEKFTELVNSRNEAIRQLLGSNDIVRTADYDPNQLKNHRLVFKVIE